MLIELKRIGNNLNQITAKINAGAFRSYNFKI
ncbi:MAG: plasmid mobilization relaxosome protein MobC [Oscillospiraceae bacterium]